MTGAAPRSDEQIALERWIGDLHALCPLPLTRPTQICTCEDCIAPAKLALLEDAQIDTIQDNTVSAYFGAAGGPRLSPDQKCEGRFFFVKVLEALGRCVVSPSPGESTLTRGHWYVEPDYWLSRVFETQFQATFSEADSALVSDYLLFLCRTACQLGSPRLWDCLEYLGAFTNALENFVADVRDWPTVHQVAFWSLILGGHLGTPAAKQGKGFIELHRMAKILPQQQLPCLINAFGDPRIGRYLERAADRVRDADMQDFYVRAYVFWSNSVEAMALPR